MIDNYEREDGRIELDCVALTRGRRRDAFRHRRSFRRIGNGRHSNRRYSHKLRTRTCRCHCTPGYSVPTYTYTHIHTHTDSVYIFIRSGLWLLFCIFMVALCNRADHYIFILFLSSFFFFLFTSPNVSGRRLYVYHTLAHGVALVRI